MWLIPPPNAWFLKQSSKVVTMWALSLYLGCIWPHHVTVVFHNSCLFDCRGQPKVLKSLSGWRRNYRSKNPSCFSCHPTWPLRWPTETEKLVHVFKSLIFISLVLDALCWPLPKTAIWFKEHRKLSSSLSIFQGFTFLISSDYERAEWREIIREQQKKCKLNTIVFLQDSFPFKSALTWFFCDFQALRAFLWPLWSCRCSPTHVWNSKLFTPSPWPWIRRVRCLKMTFVKTYL